MRDDEPPYRAIADSTYDWETWIDEHDRVRWVNPAVQRLTGYEPDECLAMPGFPLAIVHPDDRARAAEVLRSAREGRTGNDVELRIVRKDGSTRFVAISWQPLIVPADGARRGLRTSVRDIQERKIAEERLREAERQASRSAHERAELLATLSHELRSPLQCIAGFAELLAREPLDGERRRWLELVSVQSDTLLRLVEDLLEHASPGGPPVLRRMSFDLAALVEHEVDAMRPRVHDGVVLGAAIDERARGTFEGDPDQLRRVLANLLSNATRFTKRGRIDVRLAVDEDELVLEVRDTGVGMSDALLEHAREPFVQGAPGASSRSGVGLGLAIVDRLLDAMGGTLALESHEGQGTRAVVRFRLSRTSAAAQPGTPAVEHDPRVADVRVLVVDDSDPARELLGAMFRTLGVHVDTVEDGRSALERARSERYDLVVIDYHMPELDGLETARLVRAETHLASTRPVLALLTANVLAEPRHDPVGAGLDVVLVKPLRLDHARGLVRLAIDGADRARTVVAPPRRAGIDEIDREVVHDLASVRGADGTTLLVRTVARVRAHAADAIAKMRASEPRAGDAHALKGLVASIGARRAAERAGALETALREGLAREVIEARIDALERDLDRALTTLDAM
ncbi:ATP-binding protein [Sandaracinus amylolyticus]|uniref:histidine kinase n=1 Tax=Sandaracinus amylolyticus TaxID=927083 RepID=A0A0F6W580_9BACT|nr:ATP-binding protein [Sandaracinus amylolyticus]AKF07736.1 Hypothetical protein DB32_004885 [Sandaracinus amylolyticus]